MKGFLALILATLFGWSHAASAQNEFVVEESAIECIRVIGPAPELREMSRRVAKRDPGPMVGFVVKLSERANRRALDAFGDVTDSPYDGFQQSRGGVVRLDLSAAGDEFRDTTGGTTPTLPRDRFVLFTMSESVAKYIESQRSRCGSRLRFDTAPFEQLLRGNRETLRGMLDQERR
ncbi:MAG: hypothetical protein HOJ90_14370 [Alphaproteobacteria bacterium]|jgi:hypothetical protein|nr:hypothetical protein [Alphaproteobacteria bacterium]